MAFRDKKKIGSSGHPAAEALPVRRSKIRTELLGATRREARHKMSESVDGSSIWEGKPHAETGKTNASTAAEAADLGVGELSKGKEGTSIAAHLRNPTGQRGANEPGRSR